MKQLRIFSGFVLAVVMATMLGCASSSTQSSDGVGGYLDDSVITTKVKSAIYDEPSLKVSDINVVTVKGAVQLNGDVTSRVGKRKAEQVTRKVEGVKSVKNNLRIVKKSKIKKKPVQQEEQKQE